MKNGETNLGDRAKDTITGFEGTVIAITSWLNGCRRIGIQPNKLTKEGKPIEMEMFDEHQVEVITPHFHKPDRRTGGPWNDAAACKR